MVSGFSGFGSFASSYFFSLRNSCVVNFFLIMASKMFEYDLKISTPFGAQKWDVASGNQSKIRRSLTLKFKAAIGVAAVLVILIVVVIVVCFLLPFSKDRWMPEYDSSSELGRYQYAAISTDAAPCAVIGKDILKKNGSAIDATIAVLLCMGVVNPQSLGLGGGFLMLYYNKAERKTYYMDARETAPRKSSVNMFGGNATLSSLGGLSIAVPGELAGYYSAHRRFGALPWEELFPPTIKMCREGIQVNAHLAKALKKYENQIKAFETIRKVFVNNETGEVFQQNDIIYRPDLAATLEIIAKEKINALYGNTPTANRFLADMKAAGSIIDKIDMQSYSPKMRAPVMVPMRGNMTLYGTSPPGSGALLAFMLHVLGGYPEMNPNVTKTRESTVLALHRILETFKFAYARRMDMEDDDSEEMRELVQNLTSSSYADQIRSMIDDSRTYNDPSHYGVNVTVEEDHGTAHVSVIAPNGDAVSATSTINLYFGSMVMSESTGIILNNEMDDFSSPNITNYFGVPPTRKNHIHPLKRPMSSMSPAIVIDSEGDVKMTLGANGGTQITTSVAQVILRHLYLGDNIKKCIDAPRFHHQLLPNYIEYEQLFPQDLLDDLMKMGHKTHTLGTGMIGIVMGITRGEDKYLYANSDYRKGGKVDGF